MTQATSTTRSSEAGSFGADLVGKTKKAKVDACRARVQSAGKAAQRLEEDVRWLVKERAWEVLDYANFSEMWEKECGFKCPTHVQALGVDALRMEGMNTRFGAAARQYGPDGHMSAAVAKMIGLATQRGGRASSMVSRITTQLAHGVPASEVRKNPGRELIDIVNRHGTVPYEPRARAKPQRMGKLPDENVSESFDWTRRESDEAEALSRLWDVPRAEVFRRGARLLLDRHRVIIQKEVRDGAA